MVIFVSADQDAHGIGTGFPSQAVVDQGDVEADPGLRNGLCTGVALPSVFFPASVPGGDLVSVSLASSEYRAREPGFVFRLVPARAEYKLVVPLG